MQHADTDYCIIGKTLRESGSCLSIANQHPSRVPDPVLTNSRDVRTQFQRVKLTTGLRQALGELTRASSDLEAAHSRFQMGGINQESGAALRSLLPGWARPSPNMFKMFMRDQCSLASLGGIPCFRSVGRQAGDVSQTRSGGAWSRLIWNLVRIGHVSHSNRFGRRR